VVLHKEADRSLTSIPQSIFPHRYTV